MKVPYRTGEWYDLPLGDGSFLPICIVRVHHHVVDIAAFEDPGATPVAALRVSDRALVLHRWRRSNLRGEIGDLQAENAKWITAAHAERIVASRVNRLPFAEKALEVCALRSGEAIHGSMFSWNEPLDSKTLESLIEYVTQNPHVTIRPYGTAAAQLREFAGVPVRRIRITTPYTFDAMPQVNELHIEQPMDVPRVLEKFPNLRAVRIAANGIDVALKALPGTVRVVDCSHAASVALHDAPPLEALRLAYLDEAPAMDAIPATLRTLSLEHLNIASLGVIPRLLQLVQLELHGLWQFDVADAEPLIAMPELLRVAVDIGGRRKNVELNKRARWAYPWPFGFILEEAALRLTDAINAALP